jgi:hypothetical protein
LITQTAPPPYPNATISFFQPLDELHNSLSYLCCLSEEQMQQAVSVVESFVWDSVEVEWTDFWCNSSPSLPSPQNESAIFLHAIASPSSQQILNNLTSSLEQHFVNSGIPIYNPRIKSGPVHHITLATVNIAYPIEQVVDALKNTYYGKKRVCWFIYNSADNKIATISIARDCL